MDVPHVVLATLLTVRCGSWADTESDVTIFLQYEPHLRLIRGDSYLGVENIGDVLYVHDMYTAKTIMA